MLEPTTQGRTGSFDGTMIAWQSFGDEDLPAIVVANGVGVRWRGMTPQIEHFSKTHRLVYWDYRGTFDSDMAGWGGLGVRAHARDGLEVMKKLGIDEAALLGWSMGAQVVTEMTRMVPDRITHVACIGGVPWSPFRATSAPLVHRLLRRIIRGTAHIAPMLAPVARPIVRGPAFFWIGRALQYVRPHTDREHFDAMAQDVANHDLKVYMRTLGELGWHDGRDLLPVMEQPLLIIAGAKDRMIRPRLIRKAAAMARNGRAVVIPDCSHFVPIEAPHQVNRALEDFFAQK